MITSYEQFKAVTSTIFNSKAKSLSEMRNAFSKSLGFSSIQAVKDSFEQKSSTGEAEDVNLSSIVVLEVVSGVVSVMKSFKNTPAGMKAAEAYLMNLVKESEGIEDEDHLLEIAEAGNYSSNEVDYSIRMT